MTPRRGESRAAIVRRRGSRVMQGGRGARASDLPVLEAQAATAPVRIIPTRRRCGLMLLLAPRDTAAAAFNEPPFTSIAYQRIMSSISLIWTPRFQTGCPNHGFWE